MNDLTKKYYAVIEGVVDYRIAISILYYRSVHDNKFKENKHA